MGVSLISSKRFLCSLLFFWLLFCCYSLTFVDSYKLVARWRIGAPVAAVRQAGGVGAGGPGAGGGVGGGGAYSSARAPPESSNTAFRGRSYRLTD